MPEHRIVAIGGSSGAINAIKSICQALPGDFPAAVLIVVHTAARGQNMLAGILNGCTTLSVTTAIDGEAVEPGHVYVAPADHHLLVIQDIIRLGRGPRENMSRPAIDPLFRSVAINSGPRAIGVLVSGMLNDGSAGLADLRRCGGVTVIQNPSDAAEAEMPRSALRASDVDYRAPADELGALLTKLLDQTPGPSIRPPPDITLEVEIAYGRRPVDSRTIATIGEPVTLSCPACGGVMSQMKQGPLRFRCQVGHGFTAETLAAEQENHVDEAIRIALRIIEERACLMTKMADDARCNSRARSADLFEERAKEYRSHIETLRRAAIREER